MTKRVDAEQPPDLTDALAAGYIMGLLIKLGMLLVVCITAYKIAQLFA